MNKLQEYIKMCRKAGLEDEAIKSYLLAHNAPQNLIDDAFRKLDFNKKLGAIAIITILITLLGVFALNQVFIGFVTQQQNTITFNETVSYGFEDTGSAVWLPEQSGEITSLLASGKIIGNGTAKVYIKINETRYLLLDTSALQKQKQASLITGMVINEELTVPQENNESTQSDLTNETIETANETIIPEETIIEKTNETIELSNDTSTFENITMGLTNDTIIPEEQIIENINETIDTQNETNELINETRSLPELNETTNEVEFENICVETCILQGLNSGFYLLEFEIEGDVNIEINNLKYTITQPIINENITEENLTLNETINQTLENITTINETLTNNTTIETNATTNDTVEIEKPVRWTLKINTNKTNEITLPAETFNITINDENAKILIKEKEFSINQYNLEKEKNILDKKLKKLEQKQDKEKKKQPKGKQTKTKYDQDITNTNTRITELKTITQNITIDQNITLTLENNQTENTSKIIEIAYYTEGPEVAEEEKGNLNKIITISSNIHYQNIKAYTEITETQKQLINLNWKTISGDIKISDVNYLDTNNNGLIDRIEWVVPHLSNQTYEVNISVLNVQSYPQVGGTWTVEFLTTGKANLTIEATDETAFGEDIIHTSLKCGEQTLTPTYDGEKVFYPDYECNQTGYHVVSVLTQGKHTQKFTFGNATAYAHNYATNLPQKINLQGKLTNLTGQNVNTTVNFTFNLYTTATGGTPAWNETQNNTNVVDGVYSVILGSVNLINLNLTQQYYLGIKVNSDPEMTPRINLTSTPYSYNTMFAESAADLTCTDCIGNTEINTTGTFTIDGNLNATNNITLGNSIIDSADSKPRLQITSTSIVINLQD